MYKKKLDLRELISENNLLMDMKDGDVYQLTQQGHDVKVMMTQEYYFQLLAKLEKFEGTKKVVKYDPTELMTNFEVKCGFK